MKCLRITALLTVAIILFAMLGGCGEKEMAYKVLESGSSDGMDKGKHTSDIQEWSYEKRNPHDDATAPAEMSVTFDGVTYNGTYQRSYTTMPNTFVSHRYKGKTENGKTVNFSVHAQTHKLAFISISYKLVQEATKDEDECRKIADAIADDYISMKDYKVKVDKNESLSYTYTYYREVSGYETADRMRIVVGGDGVVRSCDVSQLGTFKGVSKLAIDEEKATVAIEAKLQEMYGHLDVEMEHWVSKIEWVKTADGQIGRLYEIQVDFRDGQFLTGSVVELLLV